MASDWSAVAPAIADVKARVAAAAGPGQTVRLVAVSKIKPAAAVRAGYDGGQRYFGENYAKELLEKATSDELAGLDDLRWHFIGHLQSNKANTLVKRTPRLACVETVDSAKLASKLDAAVAAALVSGQRPAAMGSLDIFLQVNTSGEFSKSGVEPDAQVVELAKHVSSECANLRLGGLMTIGMPDYTSRPENFECLARCREQVAAAVGVEPSTLTLSMGMSGDFEAAISMGSTNVRVGSTIFGKRPTSKAS